MDSTVRLASQLDHFSSLVSYCPKSAGEEPNTGWRSPRKAPFGLAIDIITTQLALIRTLRGFTPKFGCFDDEEINELSIESHFVEQPSPGGCCVLLLGPEIAGALYSWRLCDSDVKPH